MTDQSVNFRRGLRWRHVQTGRVGLPIANQAAAQRFYYCMPRCMTVRTLTRSSMRWPQHYRTIAVDWPGHGDSEPVDASLEAGAPLFADVLEDVVDGLGLSRAVLIGNSVGGFAAARLAITRPESVAGLVLVNAVGSSRGIRCPACLAK